MADRDVQQKTDEWIQTMRERAPDTSDRVETRSQNLDVKEEQSRSRGATL
jgi:hypothetical protein